MGKELGGAGRRNCCCIGLICGAVWVKSRVMVGKGAEAERVAMGRVDV